ncbi:hypothetical protein GCM10023319_19270 [Nocardia iowensis]
MSPVFDIAIIALAIGGLIGLARVLLGIPSAAAARRERRSAIKHVRQHGSWPCGHTHSPPTQPFTIAQAHREMQRHLRCSLENCGRKRAAYKRLIRGGHAVPDSTNLDRRLRLWIWTRSLLAVVREPRP